MDYSRWTCPTVGFAGLSLGGGFGPFSRLLGLTCDNIVEIEVVTVQGQVLVEYYGDAMGKLMAVKNKYDPDGCFETPQGVPIDRGR